MVKMKRCECTLRDRIWNFPNPNLDVGIPLSLIVASKRRSGEGTVLKKLNEKISTKSFLFVKPSPWPKLKG